MSLVSVTDIVNINKRRFEPYSKFVDTALQLFLQLHDKARSSLRNKLSDLQVPIIDEVFMVSNRLLYSSRCDLVGYI